MASRYIESNTQTLQASIFSKLFFILIFYIDIKNRSYLIRANLEIFNKRYCLEYLSLLTDFRDRNLSVYA